MEGPALTFGEADERAARLAAYFHQLGVRPGEPVVVLLHNDLDFVATWLGLGRLGAVAVMLNTELKGMFLQHQMEDSGARIAVVARSLLPALEEIAGRLDSLKLIVLAGEDGAAPAWQ
ncbi:AMP-binding protein, partial [Rhizobiaceae sp. 2RAB30]